MQVILHLGAHRTGSTSFQTYMARHPVPDCAYWGPDVTRGGLLGGLHVFPQSPRTLRRIRGRIAVKLALLEKRGHTHLLVSDENMLGPMRSNLRCSALYPEVGMRIARAAHVFGPALGRVAVQIRALDSYWASVLAFSVSRGFAPPTGADLERLVQNTRSWRDMITELACAMPGVEISVTPFEQFAARPDLVLSHVLGGVAVSPVARAPWVNRSPVLGQLRHAIAQAYPERVSLLPAGNGGWQPFSRAVRDVLRDRYSQDLAWFRRGADGLAIYHGHTASGVADRAAPTRETTRGSEDNDSQDRRMARPC